jgi:acyl-CoA thioesterase-1
MCYCATIGIAVRFPALISAVLLCSCAKEEPAPLKVAPPVESSRAADDRPVLVAFGDSLTAGYGLDPGLSYPDVLARQLEAEGYRYRVVNAGISGDTTSGGVGRLAAVLAEKPAIVVVALGANDGLRGIPVASTRANLDRILTALKDAGAKVLLAGITLPRNYGADYIRDFDRIYPELARKHQLPLLPFLLEGVALKPGLMQADALHPNAEGTRIVAANVRKALGPLLNAAAR